jgi:hypothetical protein
MARARDLREAIASVADRPGPVFSAYVSVNAAIPENRERAYLVRVRDAMNDLAAARGARLDFVRGENENADTLRDEFGGVAGLTRF